MEIIAVERQLAMHSSNFEYVDFLQVGEMDIDGNHS